MPRLFIALICVLAVGGASGCGTDADRDAARSAAQGLYAAVRQHRGEAACAQMSPQLRAALVDDEQQRCARAVLDLDLQGRTPAAVHVYADAAQVRFAGGDTVFLEDTSHGWRVQALGCVPQGEGPFDCEAEA